MRLLLVEDHRDLSALVSGHLRARGFVVEAHDTGEAALEAVRQSAFDAVILDLGLPDIDGLEVLRRMQVCAKRDLPIVIVTARDNISQRVDGLDAGADDYILKPFNLTELEARLRAVLRRPGRRHDPAPVFQDLRYESSSRSGWCGDLPLDLTQREAILFHELIRNGSQVVVRDSLIDRLSGAGGDVSGNALEALISRLRKKLQAHGSAVHIESLRGIGYRLSA